MISSAKVTPLVNNPDRLERRLKEIPAEPGVYLMRDGSDRILYIGKSKKLRSRVRSYFRNTQPLSPRIAMMVRQVVEIEFIVTDTEAESLALEANLVKQHQPYFNVLLKDDKKYPYICITWSEDYPRIFITRKRNLRKEKDRYYGPYVDVGLLRSTLHLLKQIFPQRQRPRPLFKDRPCLNYDIGRCPGVCQQLVSPQEYRQMVQKMAMVFQGRTGELIDILSKNMEQAAESLNFELAAKIRDQIKGLNALSADQKVALPDDTVSRDAISLAADANHACIQLFQIRAGRLVGRLGFFAEVPSGGIELGAILQRVLEDHYQTVDAVEIPSEILVQHQLTDTELLAEWLSERKGRKVTILVPQRQTKAELIEMVERNAKYELERTQKFADRNSQAMHDLAAILDLSDLPHRIEGYDISHIQGANPVASQVVFINGTPAKQHYRHYKIKNPTVTIGHSDDFASLAEVIRRRFRKYKDVGAGLTDTISPQTDNLTKPALSNHQENPDVGAGLTDTISPQTHNLTKPALSREQGISNDFPDLIMIDGGKGQLSAVVAVLQDMNLLDKVRVVSLAKQREEIFLPGESLPLPTDAEQPGVQLLRRLRDEAHRFAVSFHRQQRSNTLRRSRLDEIPGLGFARQKQLLAHFRSIDYIREASVQQLAEVPGIGSRLAEDIYTYFHP
ncbi:excinuclease ABC, C subunit [Coleofasciculus chthonoplastes PCC 7420]|uniref:UvrABC system protein C n=1 Tax=Coleofasciculus chthonoplastes PCC 7420 TaxID=118168 RepID=B4VH52_9CYAN|nr:excinuclease ABC subunit UvrC [Coleofasciculus chthonoplastes]EDX78634.1 excinuclease ABC, C subunit [Coleofasciculus chthonoplastes PCC 7420]